MKIKITTLLFTLVLMMCFSTVSIAQDHQRNWDNGHVVAVTEVHIKDGIGGGPSTLLGEGDSGFYRSMEILKAHRYRGWLLLENDYGAIAAATGENEEALLRKDIALAESCL